MAKFCIEIDSDQIAQLLRDDLIAADDITHFTQVVVECFGWKPLDAYDREGDSILDKAIKKAISTVIDCKESSVYDIKGD
jgi:hypothetical protein